MTGSSRSTARLIAGVDEAGRGPLAGPVIAAAVILDPSRPVAGLADSKTLSAVKRARLEGEILSSCLAWAIGCAEVEEIDAVNILNATMAAMTRAVAGLGRQPDLVLVDGNRVPTGLPLAQAIVRGDVSEAAISAASILAKQHRDRIMAGLDRRYPGYGLARHKGYGTREHLQALTERGITPIHRKSYAPVKNALLRHKLF